MGEVYELREVPGRIEGAVRFADAHHPLSRAGLAPYVDRLAEPLTGPPVRLVGVQLSNLTRPADEPQPALPFGVR